MKRLSFNDEMARAWHEGRKTVTRRLIKFKEADPDCCWCHGKGLEYIDCGNELSGYDYRSPCRCRWPKPPYSPGEIVYIGEAWHLCGEGDDGGTEYVYRADGMGGQCPRCGEEIKWKPPATMPEWASRSRARIVSVRPERVQEISIDDIEAGGVYRVMDSQDCANDTFLNTGNFIDHWDSIYGPGSWNRNDWCWRIELEKI